MASEMTTPCGKRLVADDPGPLGELWGAHTSSCKDKRCNTRGVTVKQAMAQADAAFRAAEKARKKEARRRDKK